MEAGRELDALIAGRVMGWKLFAGEPGQGRRPDKPLSLILDVIPPYSTSMNAAWEVVEKIHDSITNHARDGKRNDLNFLTLSVLNRYGATAASFDLELDDEWFENIAAFRFAARGDTAPLAICLAALKALNVETPPDTPRS